jgi:ABC-type multidrug transport system fused ATPase/permease subunit
LYYYVASAYLNTSRELKRLESVSRSPIYGQFSETITGASTIRAYGHESRFMRQAEERVDANHRSFYYLWVSNRWLCLRTDIISAFVVFISGFAILYGKIAAGWAGLVLTYSLEVFRPPFHTISLPRRCCGWYVLGLKWK